MRTPLTLAGLALAGLLVLPAPGTAAVETCQGQPVTITGPEDEGALVEGTDGDDVIAARGLVAVHALGGDDLICLSGHLRADPLYQDHGDVAGGPGTDTLVIRASDERDHLDVIDVENLDVRLRGGKDDLLLVGAHGEGVIDAGAGDNTLIVRDDDRLRVDLEDDELLTGDSGEYTVRGFEHVTGDAPTVVLTGDRHANRLSGSGCRVTLGGGRGDDELRLGSYDCVTQRHRARGAKGDDLLVGSLGDDVLVGGPGRDRANGRQGEDRCQAERKRSCER